MSLEHIDELMHDGSWRVWFRPPSAVLLQYDVELDKTAEPHICARYLNCITRDFLHRVPYIFALKS